MVSKDECKRMSKDSCLMHVTLKAGVRLFLLDIQAVSAKKKVTKEILKAQKHFECIEGKASNNLGAKLTRLAYLKGFSM